MQLTITVEQENGHFVAHLLGRPEYRAQATSRSEALELLGRSLRPMLDEEEHAIEENQDNTKPRPVFIKLPVRNIKELFGIFKDDPDLDQICEDIYRQRDEERKREFGE